MCCFECYFVLDVMTICHFMVSYIMTFHSQSTGKFQQAWLQFSRAIELDSTSQQAYEGRAVTCLRAGNMDAAFQDISAAFRVGKPTARLHAARGVIHQYMGDVRSAMADYQVNVIIFIAQASPMQRHKMG